MNTTPQSTSTTITWTQPDGDVVDSYEVTYSYQGPCAFDVPVPSIALTVLDNTTREYTVTGLEEFSDYTITITAVKGTGRSDAAIATARTISAGVCVCVYIYTHVCVGGCVHVTACVCACPFLCGLSVSVCMCVCICVSVHTCEGMSMWYIQLVKTIYRRLGFLSAYPLLVFTTHF